MNRPDNTQAYKEASIEIEASPEMVYDLVSDLSRMGEWSPESTGGRWMEGGTGQAGDWFEGHNQVGEREWTRESQVARADRGRDFTFVVGGVEENCTWWSYEMAPSEIGTTLTEKWWFVNKTPGLALATEEQVRARVEATQGALEATIAAVKATAEAG
ncbi:MAG: SRPBCC family protein [Actinomycetia bacterium]|nr:SRPBCC family protein [Actinomycetes bacterium]